MKKLLTLSVLATCGVLFSPSAMANCYCEQGVISGDACLVPRNINSSSGSMVPIGRPICPAQSGGQALSQPRKPLPDRYHEQCQAQPSGTKLCQYIRKDTGIISSIFETNANGKVLYYRRYNNVGVIKSEIWHNQQGEVHGAFKAYHDNGKLSNEANFVNGKMQGESKVYDQNGALIEIEYYHDDKNVLEFEYANNQKHGQETQYQYVQVRGNTVQVPVRTAQWVNGVKHGEERFFEANKKGKTKLVRTVMWQNGNQVR